MAKFVPRESTLVLGLFLWIYSVFADMTFTSNFSMDNEVHSSFIQRRLRSQERREMQREILSIMGLPHRPRPHDHNTHNAAAPVFMMDLYNTISLDAQLPGYSYYKAPEYTTQAPPRGTPQDSRLLDDADMVMSFTNLGELIPLILSSCSRLTKKLSIFVGFKNSIVLSVYNSFTYIHTAYNLPNTLILA